MSEPVLPPPVRPWRAGAAGLLWESSYAAEPRRAERVIEPVHAGGFLATTHIRSAAGPGLAQSLKVGDAVVTRSGLRRQVKWIGRRAYAAATMEANPHLRPVLILPDALGKGLPAAPLRVAPTHCVLVEDAVAGSVLIPAAALVNGVSILREPVSGPVAYIHVELNSHDLLLAEGTAAETFVDASNRAMFANAAEFAALYPRHAGGDLRPCVRVLDHGPDLEHIRRRLAGKPDSTPPPIATYLRFELERRRGVLEGWAIDEAAPDTSVELDVLLDGQHYMRATANKYRPDLDRAGLAGGRCGFVCPLPSRGGHIAIRHASALRAPGIAA